MKWGIRFEENQKLLWVLTIVCFVFDKIINGISTFDKELKKVIIFCFAFNFF